MVPGRLSGTSSGNREPGRRWQRARRQIGVATLAILLLILAACGGGAPESFKGTVLSPQFPAAAFELTDQHGDIVSMAGLKGNVVALTFLYTSCTDICPIVAGELKKVDGFLGNDAEGVEIVAVSVDPKGDTVSAAQAYTERWGMDGKWKYLVGPEEALKPVWDAYSVAPAISGTPQAPAPTPAPGSVDSLRDGIAATYDIVHSAPVYLIDRQGTRRVIHTLPLDPEKVAADIRLLLREK
ncbi:MAG: SCO family protein [SAR202 cluster bacterium]|nr:SCO family protein [SAR202 cluster bacterium]